MNNQIIKKSSCSEGLQRTSALRYDVVIFDLDGTLIDSKKGITESIQYALKRMGIIEENLENLCHFIGPPLKEELKKTYHLDDDDVSRCIAYYRDRYLSLGVYEMEIYDGVEKVLKRLKKENKIIAIATSKVESVLNVLLPTTFLGDYADYIVGAKEYGNAQNKELIIQSVREMIGKCRKSYSCVMIGDTIFDILAARNIGIDAIGVSYGYGNVSEMVVEGARIIDTLEELIVDGENKNEKIRDLV